MPHPVPSAQHILVSILWQVAALPALERTALRTLLTRRRAAVLRLIEGALADVLAADQGVERCVLLYATGKPHYALQEEHVRLVAQEIKHEDGAQDAFAEAARTMAPCVPSRAILVPIPDRMGDPFANLRLALAIRKHFVGRLSEVKRYPNLMDVRPVLTRSQPDESSHERRRRGLPGLHSEEHHIVVQPGQHIAPEDLPRVVFIDNILTTGATFAAARRALGGGRGLAYARAESPHEERAAPGPQNTALHPGVSPDMDAPQNSDTETYDTYARASYVQSGRESTGAAALAELLKQYSVQTLAEALRLAQIDLGALAAEQGPEMDNAALPAPKP